MNFIVFLDAQDKPVHELGYWRNVDAAEGADNAGLGHASGQIASQESGLVNGKSAAVKVV